MCLTDIGSFLRPLICSEVFIFATFHGKNNRESLKYFCRPKRELETEFGESLLYDISGPSTTCTKVNWWTFEK